MKRSLRKRVSEARDRLSPEERETKSREIEKRLFRLPEFGAASTIMFFASFRSEVETGSMIRHALALGKRVILPKVKDKDLALFEIRDYEKDVAPGAWGIPEPREAMPVAIDAVNLIITPGLAFDERGNRLGYGAGFYDRILSAHKEMSIALAFEIQIAPHVPVSAHDVPVKKIVTEERVITAHGA